MSSSRVSEITRIDNNINNVENKLSRLMDLYLENTITKREYCARKEKLLNDKYKLQKNIEYLQRGQFLWLEFLGEFINGLDKPKNILKNDDLQKKRELLEKIGSNFTFRPDGRSAAAFCGGEKIKIQGVKNRTMTAQITLDFKEFWAVLAQENTKTKSVENAEEKFCTIWLGRKDSNLRVAGPKPAALPLGDAPIIQIT
ncbi:hypothetical protein NO2_0490 [Candidatus Termititenax persephonae]|uniref:Uncharacterized protein n=1 Tax=Candidatus Termititenax persephonae TaxID=2218525 RepID=A0A388TFL9_9BACT|nr:hypothetical protein NO2_0490 [Candidatus Termititenax persephonae]